MLRKTVDGHAHERHLKADWYKSGVRRTGSEVDVDWHIEELSALLQRPTNALAKLVWNTLASTSSEVLLASYRPNQHYSLRTAPSSLIIELRSRAWIPQKGKSFVRPAEASRDLLPEGFPFDPGWPWLGAIDFGEEVVKRSDERLRKESVAREFGFTDSESLERAQRFAALPPEDQKQILADQEYRAASQLPEHEPLNPARRASGVAEKAATAPNRITEERTRSVSIGRAAVKEETAQYLRQQYTIDGDVVCQICKAPMPFKLDDGTDYFEKVEFLPELKKRHYQNYLALCPNHAAMFKEVNDSSEFMRDVFAELTGNELEVVLARENSIIYFTKTHIADLKKVLEVDEDATIEKTKSD